MSSECSGTDMPRISVSKIYEEQDLHIFVQRDRETGTVSVLVCKPTLVELRFFDEVPERAIRVVAGEKDGRVIVETYYGKKAAGGIVLSHPLV